MPCLKFIPVFDDLELGWLFFWHIATSTMVAGYTRTCSFSHFRSLEGRALSNEFLLFGGGWTPVWSWPFPLLLFIYALCWGSTWPISPCTCTVWAQCWPAGWSMWPAAPGPAAWAEGLPPACPERPCRTHWCLFLVCHGLPYKGTHGVWEMFQGNCSTLCTEQAERGCRCDDVWEATAPPWLNRPFPCAESQTSFKSKPVDILIQISKTPQHVT